MYPTEAIVLEPPRCQRAYFGDRDRCQPKIVQALDPPNAPHHFSRKRRPAALCGNWPWSNSVDLRDEYDKADAFVPCHQRFVILVRPDVALTGSEQITFGSVEYHRRIRSYRENGGNYALPAKEIYMSSKN
jgi:hypothetical protein